MKKTTKILEKYYYRNFQKKNLKNEKDSKVYSFQFLKYHAFYASTPPSIMPMFYGVKFNGKKEEFQL